MFAQAGVRDDGDIAKVKARHALRGVGGPLRAACLIPLAALLAACAQTHAPGQSTWTRHGVVTTALVPPAGIREPGKREVVVVINANHYGGAHAGMFAGERLYDPSGTYVGVRAEDPAWRHPTLADYIAYQLKDGPDVRLYRFSLMADDFDAIESRIEHAGWTMPMFCASSVQSVLAGIGPFTDIESSWWTSPRQLGERLADIKPDTLVTGRCTGPDAQSC